MPGRAEVPPVPGLDVSRETAEALDRYAQLLAKWNTAINLVGKTTVDEIWSRHILDSAQLLAFSPANPSRWCDLGSGGGLPGLVVAIIMKERAPDCHVTLIESDRRKAVFLRTVVDTLALNASVSAARIEAAEPARADVLSARALAALPLLLGYASRHLAPHGTALLPKGRNHRSEVEDARRSWHFDLETAQSVVDAEGAILVIRNLRRLDPQP